MQALPRRKHRGACPTYRMPRWTRCTAVCALRHSPHIRRTHGACPALLPAAPLHAARTAGYPLLAPPPYVTRYSPHPHTSHAPTCVLRWQPPLAPLHAVHLRLAATHACPPLHVARAAGRTRKGVGTVRLVPTRMCAPHTLYACARPPRTPRASHAPPRLPYNHAGARVQHICAPYVLNPVRRGVRCAANRRHTCRPSYAWPAAVHACTGSCRSACA